MVTIDEAQDLLNEIVGSAESLAADLGAAESCEEVSDFQANIQSVIDNCETLLTELRALRLAVK